MNSIQRAVSDMSHEMEKVLEVVYEADCGCCGQKEECTKEYIVGVKENHAGTWVCGLCGEAIKEYLSKNPQKPMEEAVFAHNEICRNFNITTRINPKLTLTWAMKDIAKRCLEDRMLKNSSIKCGIYRSSSCIPRIINPNTKH